MLIFFSTNDRVAFISTGKGLQGRLTPSVIRNIIKTLRPGLREHKYGEAIKQCIAHIDISLSTEESFLSWLLETIGGFLALMCFVFLRSPGLCIYVCGCLLGLLYIIVSILVRLLYYSCYPCIYVMESMRNRHTRRLQRGRSALERIVAEIRCREQESTQSVTQTEENEEHGNNNLHQHIFESLSCPICLEDFIVSNVPGMQ